jgi:hypothetical protein
MTRTRKKRISLANAEAWSLRFSGLRELKQRAAERVEDEYSPKARHKSFKWPYLQRGWNDIYPSVVLNQWIYHKSR